LDFIFIFSSQQTYYLSKTLKDKTLTLDIDDLWDIHVSNTTALTIMMETAQLVTKNTTEAISGIDAGLYFIQPSQSDQLLKSLIDEYEFYELLRWPITLGFLTFLLFLCTVLVIGVARSSRCLLIFFSVLGLFTVAICWLLSGIYLAISVGVADFCVQPYQHICNQQRLQYIYQSNCGASGTNHFVIRLSNSRDSLDLAKHSLESLEEMGRRILPTHNVPGRVGGLHSVLDYSANVLTSEQIEKNSENLKIIFLFSLDLTDMLDSRAIQFYYSNAAKSFCHGGLFGLALMMIATIATAFLLTILVCVDSHTWIYLTKR
jgi:protein tweety